MSATETPTIVTGVDFVSVPTRDLEQSVAFYGTTLGLPRTTYRPERNFAEFDTGTVTFSVVDPVKMGIGEFNANKNHFALQVDSAEELDAWVAYLRGRGVECTQVMERGTFRSTYVRDPDGHLVELATRGPGWSPQARAPQAGGLF